MRTHKARARNRDREVLQLHTARAGICTDMVQRMRTGPHQAPRIARPTALLRSTGVGAQDRRTRSAMAVKKVDSTGGRGLTEATLLGDTTGEALKATCRTRNRARPRPITTAPRPTMRKAAAHSKARRMVRRGTCTGALWEEAHPACTTTPHTAVVRPIIRGRRALVLLRTNTKALDMHMTTHHRTGMRRTEGAGPLATIWAHMRMARRERTVQVAGLLQAAGLLPEAVLLLTWARARAASGCTRCWKHNFAMPAASSVTSTLTPSIV